VTPVIDPIYTPDPASMYAVAQQIIASEMTCVATVSGSSLTGQMCDYGSEIDDSTASATSPPAATTPSMPSTSPSTNATPTDTSQTVATPASPTSTQAYATGICSIHVLEEDRCNPPDSDLFGTVTVKDNVGNVLCGGSDLIVSLNDKNPGKLNCQQLPYPIMITGEHVGDYVQFNYGSESWRSTDKAGSGAWCNTGVWDDSGKHCPTGASVSF